MIENTLINIYFPGEERVPLSDNFKAGEFKCNHGDFMWLVAPDLIRKLQLMRRKCGHALVIVSGYRTPEYNLSIGGAKQSRHMAGMAADVTPPSSLTATELAGLAYFVGCRRIGLGKTFVHVDVAPGEAYWDYDNDSKTDPQAAIKQAAVAWK